jgi:hypothetical protein
VNDAVRVSFSQGIGDLGGDGKRLAHTERFVLYSDIEGFAFDVLHHDETAVIVFADFIHRADVRMV